MFFPMYIQYSDDKQSSQACKNKMMINIKTLKHTDIFGKAGIKVTRSISYDLILYLVFFLSLLFFFSLSTLSH